MKLGNYILTVFFFIVLSFVLNGQSRTIDSLRQVLQIQKEDSNKVNTLNQLGEALISNGHNNEAMEEIDKAIQLSKKINFKNGEGKAHIKKGIFSIQKMDYITGEQEFLLAIKIFEGIKDTSRLIESRNYLSLIYFNEAKYNAALELIYKTLNLAEERGDKKSIGDAYQAIGACYISLENPSQAKIHYQKALDLREEMGNREGFAQTSITLADIFINEKNYSKALDMVLKAREIFKEPDMPIWGLAMAYSRLGAIYSDQADIAQLSNDLTIEEKRNNDALENYKLSLEAWEAAGDSSDLGEPYCNLGDMYFKLKQLDNAKDCFEKGLELSRRFDIKRNIIGNLNGLANVYGARGDYKKAFEYFKEYISRRDSILNEENNKKGEQVRMQYEFDKKEAISKAEQEKKDEAARRAKNLQYFAIGIFLLITVFLFIYSRQKQKAKTKIEKAYTELKSTQQQLIQSEKMASLGELTAGIAHEIQNPLNFVNNFSDVNKELVDELSGEIDKENYTDAKAIAKDIKENEEKINHHGRRADAIVKGMLQHSRASSGQKEPTDINALCDEYLRLAYHGLRAKDKSFNATTKTDFDKNVEKVNVVSQDLGRVILNLINNAFYAVNEKAKQNLNGFEPTVIVSTKTVKPSFGGLAAKIEIKVKDNGNGIPQKNLDKIFQPFFTTKPTGQGTGLGLSLAYDIITKGHGGELKVITKEKEGCEFIIQLPS